MDTLTIIPINSLSDFKKKVKAGVKLHTLHHLKSLGRDESGEIQYTTEDLGVATVKAVQTNAMVVERKKKDGTLYGSWFHFPKASECRIEEGKLIYLDEIRKIDNSLHTVPSLTYSIVE